PRQAQGEGDGSEDHDGQDGGRRFRIDERDRRPDGRRDRALAVEATPATAEEVVGRRRPYSAVVPRNSQKVRGLPEYPSFFAQVVGSTRASSRGIVRPDSARPASR